MGMLTRLTDWFRDEGHEFPDFPTDDPNAVIGALRTELSRYDVGWTTAASEQVVAESCRILASAPSEQMFRHFALTDKDRLPVATGNVFPSGRIVVEWDNPERIEVVSDVQDLAALYPDVQLFWYKPKADAPKAPAEVVPADIVVEAPEVVVSEDDLPPLEVSDDPDDGGGATPLTGGDWEPLEE
jgi:hypothetical protein